MQGTEPSPTNTETFFALPPPPTTPTPEAELELQELELWGPIPPLQPELTETDPLIYPKLVILQALYQEKLPVVILVGKSIQQIPVIQTYHVLLDSCSTMCLTHKHCLPPGAVPLVDAKQLPCPNHSSKHFPYIQIHIH